MLALRLLLLVVPLLLLLLLLLRARMGVGRAVVGRRGVSVGAFPRANE